MAKLSPQTKQLMFHGFNALGGFNWLRLLRRRWATIVFYHRFSEKDEPFKLRADHFEHQIRFFKKQYNIVSLLQYEKALGGEFALPDNPLILTIDDGYWDNYHVAFPILKQYNIPATIFLTTDFIDKKYWLWSNKLEYVLKNSKSDTFSFEVNGTIMDLRVGSFQQWHQSQLSLFNALRCLADEEKNQILEDLANKIGVIVPAETQDDFQPLTWQEVKIMHQAGIEFGSHSKSHAILSRVPEQQLFDELEGSKKIIENAIQQNITSFCYPNGQPEDYSDNVMKALKIAGYRCAVTTIRGLNPPPDKAQPFELKRVSASTTDPVLLSRQLL